MNLEIGDIIIDHDLPQIEKPVAYRLMAITSNGYEFRYLGYSEKSDLKRIWHPSFTDFIKYGKNFRKGTPLEKALYILY